MNECNKLLTFCKNTKEQIRRLFWLLLVSNEMNSFQTIAKGGLEHATIHKFPKANWGHWNDRENQLDFFKQISSKFNIKEPKDWGSNLF